MKKSSSEKKAGHVVAWLNKAEWDQVLEHLYSKDVSLQRFAVHRISAWRARYAHSTPVAVDCTADLVRCQVLDRSGQLHGDDLVLLYGAALVRFVNQITERQQGRVARPLRRLAGNLNIPEWVVDLRHDFTHKKLPTLKWCRKGCKVVLEWLQQKYWSRQLGGGPDTWDSQSDDEEDAELKLLATQKEMENYKTARKLLVSYEQDRYQSPDGLQGDREGSLWQTPLADLSWLLGEVKQFALESSETLVDVLLEDGFLVPTAEQLETLGCDPSEDPRPAEPRLPQTFLRFWLPLLKALNAASFVHLLLERLFAELKLLSNEQNQNRHRTFYLSAWASELLLCNRSEVRFETKVQKKARVRDRIFVNRIQLRWQQLLSWCLGAPCVGTPHLLRLILDDMDHPLPPETRQNLLRLCSIYTQTAHAESGTALQQPLYTLESLHEKHRQLWRSAASSDRTDTPQDLKRAEVLAERAKALRGSPWQVSSDNVPWKNFALGKVPGQSDDPSCLMVEAFSPMAVLDQPVDLDGTGTQNDLGASGSTRTAEGVLWSQSDVSRLKSGLKLF